MKTAVIFCECEPDLKYFILEGDFRRFNGNYINSSLAEPSVEAELTNLFFGNDGVLKFQPVSIVAFADAVRGGAFVIEVGFIP